MTQIQKRLFAAQDCTFQAFQAKLMPTVAPEQVIGVRTPVLRALARELAGTAEAEAFLQMLPHRYFEENQLHAFLLGYIRDFDACVTAVDTFLPFVDNWATCDQLSPPEFKKNLTALRMKTEAWMASDMPYTVRFGIEMRMRYFLDAAFEPQDLVQVAAISSEEYYVKMMIAWYFATALAKQYDAAIDYLTQRRLPDWVHRKTIQKAVESYRILPEHKAFLRALRA